MSADPAEQLDHHVAMCVRSLTGASLELALLAGRDDAAPLVAGERECLEAARAGIDKALERIASRK